MTRKASNARKAERAERTTQLEEPKPPFPKQHQQSPGLESKLEPRPRYEARAYKAAGKLDGKTALITGGDSGIGRAVAVLFAREGADIAINYLEKEQSDAEKTRDEVEACGRKCELIAGDLSAAETCDRLVEDTVERLGKLDILVSNAAYQRRKDNLDELDDEELEYTFDTNILAYIRLSRAALRHMQPGAAIRRSRSSSWTRAFA